MWEPQQRNPLCLIPSVGMGTSGVGLSADPGCFPVGDLWGDGCDVTRSSRGLVLEPMLGACPWAHHLCPELKVPGSSSEPSRHGAREWVLPSYKALTLPKWLCWPRPLRAVLFPLKSSARLWKWASANETWIWNRQKAQCRSQSRSRQPAGVGGYVCGGTGIPLPLLPPSLSRTPGKRHSQAAY